MEFTTKISILLFLFVSISVSNSANVNKPLGVEDRALPRAPAPKVDNRVPIGGGQRVPIERDQRVPIGSNEKLPIGQRLPEQNPIQQQNVPNPPVRKQADMVRQEKAAPPKQMQQPLVGLVASEECREDIDRICRTSKKKKDPASMSNLELLSCLTNSLENDGELSPACHHYLWQYKVNITKDPKFDTVAREVCRDAIEKFQTCKDEDTNEGKLIPCLLDNKDQIKNRGCYHFLIKMGSIIYSDYRLICKFVDNCADDINQNNCGRIDSSTKDQEQSPGHSQGSVLHCLEEKIVGGTRVAPECAKQIVRLSELASDDYHLDKNLYFSCKDDRERHCENVKSGEGQVYKCLYKHKFAPEMSSKCREALTLRQKLVSQDYKSSYNVHTFCQKDIEDNQCLSSQYSIINNNDHNDHVGLSGILLCLENAKIAGQTISEQCDAQLMDFRRMLSEDYEINPEIVQGCASEIMNACNGGVQKKGETIHCLLALGQGKNQQVPLSESCDKALMHLLKENEAGYDYRMDHALSKACSPVVSSVCKDFQEGDPMILSCLMENMYSNVMTTACQKRLVELQYFISRDFFLDPIFTKKCGKDAKRLCDTKLHENENAMPLSLVVSCLYRHIKGKSDELDKSKITSEVCAEEVYKVMSNRALDVNLNPELEQACLEPLGKHCSDDIVEKDSELRCLQDHINDIMEDKNEECLAQLEEYTQIEEEDAGRLDTLLMKACQPEVEKWCMDVLNDGDEGKVMQCLIENKMELNEACEAGVSHFQLIEMKDVKFNYRFMKACKGDIDVTCASMKDGVHTKLDVIACLSEAHRNAKLEERESPISAKCLEQLTVENLQAHEDYRLDPDLSKYCTNDYEKFCKDVKPGHAKGIECLRSHKNKLSSKCRTKLFGFEKDEADNRNLDFSMMRACKSAIKNLCQHALKVGDPNSILDCLVHSKDSLDKGCREVVLQRQREEYSDINLHPELKMACMKDITKKCKSELQLQEADERDGNALQGRVIACLKAKETSQGKADQLSSSCSRHIKYILQQEQNEYSLDPMLTLKCVDAINMNCDPSSHPNVVECLKQSYFEGKLKNYQDCTIEVARLLKEGRFDVMADPILHNTCLEDIRVHCHDVAEGQGRIMGCLIQVVNDGHQSMTPNCRDTLIQRQKMWSYAKDQGLASFGDLGFMVMNSPHQSYLLTGFTLFLLVILILGVLCGRVTKRVSRQRKML